MERTFTEREFFLMALEAYREAIENIQLALRAGDHFRAAQIANDEWIERLKVIIPLVATGAMEVVDPSELGISNGPIN